MGLTRRHERSFFGGQDAGVPEIRVPREDGKNSVWVSLDSYEVD